jgi:hypothetical protein
MTTPNIDAFIAEFNNLKAENIRLKREKRDFAIHIGQEVSSWIDSNDPLPDVERIVDQEIPKWKGY